MLAAAAEEIEDEPETMSQGETMPTKVEDLIRGDIAQEPWQHQKYDPGRAVWQAAAQRRRMHHRRTNVSLGVCAVDLSGIQEFTPRDGRHITKDMGRYFLVLTVRPDMTTQTFEIGTQTGSQDGEVSATTQSPERPTLIYVAILGTKDEAAGEIKKLLAQVNNDHANFPNELVFSVHSDKGGEFQSEEFKAYCAQHGTHKTTTAGYDPNANSAENAVGRLKNRARMLLSGARMPINWWGMAVLAAAQLFRADAGLEPYPRIPFGTQAMIVTDPKPTNSFAPRAEAGTIFGPAADVPGGYYTYQHGMIKVRTNIATAG